MIDSFKKRKYYERVAKMVVEILFHFSISKLVFFLNVEEYFSQILSENFTLYPYTYINTNLQKFLFPPSLSTFLNSE